MKKLKILFYFIKEYLTVMLLMTVIRVLFLLINLEKFKSIDFSLILTGFFYGFVFDTSIASYYLIGFIICFVLFRFFKSFYLGVVGKIVLKIYKIIMSTLIFGIMFIDIKYYKQFGFHIDLKLLNISEMKESVLTSLSGKLWVSLLVMFIFIEIIYLFISFKFFRELEIDERISKSKYYFNFKVSFLKKIKDFILEVVLCFSVSMFCVFGAKGGFYKEILEKEKVYFSKNYFINQIMANETFTLLKNIKL